MKEKGIENFSIEVIEETADYKWKETLMIQELRPPLNTLGLSLDFNALKRKYQNHNQLQYQQLDFYDLKNK